MQKFIIVFLTVVFTINSSKGQSENYSDMFLTSSFKTFHSADFEMAYHILPFLRERFTKELEDSESFSNPFDSLSNYVGIKYSSDSLVKTYSWSERNGSCCHTSATFAQFKTRSGKINYVDLEELENGDEEIFITDLQAIEIENRTHYLILGWGTCCGGKQYSTARVYEIKDEKLVQSGSIFNDQTEIHAGANRSEKIEMKYSPSEKILSYKHYLFDEDIGFYERKGSLVKWELTEGGFRRID